MYAISCEFDSYYGSKIIQMNLYNFDKFGPFHTFLSITNFNIPLKVPHLLALGHIFVGLLAEIHNDLSGNMSFQKLYFCDTMQIDPPQCGTTA